MALATLISLSACGGGERKVEAPKSQGCPGDSVEIADKNGALCVDRTEVTLGAYLDCVGKAQCTNVGEGRGCNKDSLEGQAQPVNCVDLKQAETFCAARGGRLPSEAEWGRVARGSKKADKDGICASTGMPRPGTCATSRRNVDDDGRGIIDLFGNVAEWTSSGDDRMRIARGGSWQSSTAAEIGPDARREITEGTRHPALGFRCVRDR